MAEHLDRLQAAILDIGGRCKTCDRILLESDLDNGGALEMDEGAYCAPCWAEAAPKELPD